MKQENLDQENLDQENLDQENLDQKNTRSISLEKKVIMYSPLTLAYMGDSVLDLMIKKHFVSRGQMQVQKYHKQVTRVVSAVNQAAFIDWYEDKLTETEEEVYHRGRNASVHTKAKNATMGEYKKATGLEAILGYLYLSEQGDRLCEIVDQLLTFSTGK